VRIRILLLSILISGCATTQSPKDKECGAAEMLSGISCIEPNLDEISKHPLGSYDNPIRADGPRGQREYLSKLICPNGEPIQNYDRSGSVGIGPYGFMLDHYNVNCEQATELTKAGVYMDMYHKGYKEAKVSNGFNDLAK
jgi:hypothetical protein